MPRPKEILDARDRRVPAFRLPATRRGQLRFFTPAEVDRMAAKCSESSAATKRLMHAAAAFMFILVTAVAVRLVGQFNVGTAFVAVAFLLITIVMFRAARSKSIPSMPEHEVTALLLGEGYCASCAYRLETARTAPETESICSECGAAWQVAPTCVSEETLEPLSTSASAPAVTHDCFPFAAATADPTIIDAKGRRVALFPMQRRSRWRPALTSGQWSTAGHEATWLAAPYIVVGWFCFAGALRALTEPGGLLAGVIPGWGRGFLILAGGVAALYVITGPPRLARHTSAMLRLSRCPSCSAPIDLHVLDSSGHHVCRTCAASWHPGARTRLTLRPRFFGKRPPVVTGDHRGIMHPIFDAEILRPPGHVPQFLTKEAWRDLRKEFLASDWYAAVYRMCSVALLIVAISMITTEALRSRPPSLISWVFLAMAIPWTLRSWRGLGNDPRRIIDTLVKRHRCGSCGNDLRSLQAADDGCTQCPECGAAWRLSHQKQPSSIRAGD